MIQPLTDSPVNTPTAQVRPTNKPAGLPTEAFAIDLDKLFTPSERKTIENMKAYSKKQGMSNIKIQELEAGIITSKYSEKGAGNNISIKEILSRQIRGIQDGYGNNNGPSLASLKNLYDNFLQLQGAELFA